MLVLQFVSRIAGRGIGLEEDGHATHLELRIALVRIPHHPRRGNKLVVQGLQPVIWRDLKLVARALETTEDGGAKHGTKAQGRAVDLVKGKPVPHLILVALEQNMAQLLVTGNQLVPKPAVKAPDEGVGGLIMRERYQGLDPMPQALIEDGIVEPEAGLVRLGLEAGGKDATPVDGGTKDVKAHLGKEGYVLLVVMIEVYGLMTRIELPRIDVDRNDLLLVEHPSLAVIGYRVTLAIKVPRTLELVRGAGAAPQEPLLETHDQPLSIET